MRACVTESKLHARLKLVHESATRSAHLVSQLLALARAEPEASMAQSRTRFDPQRLAREVAAEQMPARARRRHRPRQR
jgi:two-component system sensor histidine kinase TctE